MSPDKEPPKFRLISVPMVKCKPPKSPVTLASSPGFDDPRLRFSLVEAAPNIVNLCHLSHPALAMCCEQAVNAFEENQSADFHPEYFNTIPLKSPLQKTCALAAHNSVRSFREKPPSSELIHEFAYRSSNPIQTGSCKCSSLEQPICPIVLQHDPKFPKETNRCSDGPPPRHSFPFSGSNVQINGELKPRDIEEKNGETTPEVTNSDEGKLLLNDFDRVLDELFGRKTLLLEKLSQEEQKLKELTQKEQALSRRCNIQNGSSNNIPNGHIHTSLSDLSSHEFRVSSTSGGTTCLRPPFKWRNSRRSKSAHERAPESASPKIYPAYRYSDVSNPFYAPSNPEKRALKNGLEFNNAHIPVGMDGNHAGDKFTRIRVLPQTYVSSANIQPFPASIGYTYIKQSTKLPADCCAVDSDPIARQKSGVHNGSVLHLPTHQSQHHTAPKWTTVRRESRPSLHQQKVTPSPPPLPPKICTRYSMDKQLLCDGRIRCYPTTVNSKVHLKPVASETVTSGTQMQFLLAPMLQTNLGNGSVKKEQVPAFYMHTVGTDIPQTCAVQLNQPSGTLSWHPIINTQPVIPNKSTQTRFFGGYEFLTEDQLRAARPTAQFISSSQLSRQAAQQQQITPRSNPSHLLPTGMWPSFRPTRQEYAAQIFCSDVPAAHSVTRANDRCGTRGRQSTNQTYPFRPIGSTNAIFTNRNSIAISESEKLGSYVVQMAGDISQGYGEPWKLPVGPGRTQALSAERKLSDQLCQSWVPPTHESSTDRQILLERTFLPANAADNVLFKRSLVDRGRDVHHYPFGSSGITTRVNLPPWQEKHSG
ncbi:hypothetical protein CRM22_009876 [Opisthorchis felineus]|uniref:Uncharacterized protein n=1 Tax=Opisthorchis felineus TaxID=147828 RepID=A0A4S2LB23_OPIFE|nr:hypothetical protein CRM22_009876 [Opisthorchis felineus]